MAWLPIPAGGPILLGALTLHASALAQATSPPTWHGAIQRDIATHCGGCHRPGTPAPFVLASYEDVRRRRSQILRMVEARTMPPWLPDTTHAEPLADDRRLSDATIERLQRWVAAGAPEGDPAAAPAAELQTATDPAPAWRLGTPDLIVRPGAAVAVAADGVDTFRNLVIPLALERPRWVRAVEWGLAHPAVHHAVLHLDRSGQCRTLDAADPGPGFGGMDMGSSGPPGGYFVGWTPGKAPRPLGAGMAFALQPGDDLVVQLHLTPTGKAEAVAVQLGLYFTDTAPTREPVGLMLSREDIVLPAGRAGHVVRDRMVLPAAIELHGVYPHAHYLGRRFSIHAQPPDGARRDLLSIPRWDFNWQDDYRFAEPVVLPAGTALTMEVEFDNSAANPFQTSQPPIEVRFGFGSRDEMATASFLGFPLRPETKPLFDEARWRHEVEQKPDDWFCRTALARVLVQSGRPREALPHLQHALRIQDDAVDAWTVLAAALVGLGDEGGAIRALEESLTLQADQPQTRIDLAGLRLRQGDAAGAQRELLAVLARHPGHFFARVQLGQLHASQGAFAEAVAAFERALQERPEHAPLWNNLGSALLDAGRSEDAVGAVRRALALDGDYALGWINLGRIHVARGERTDALAALQRAAALAPDHPGVGALREALERRP